MATDLLGQDFLLLVLPPFFPSSLWAAELVRDDIEASVRSLLTELLPA